MNIKDIILYNVKEIIDCRAPMEMDILMLVSIEMMKIQSTMIYMLLIF